MGTSLMNVLSGRAAYQEGTITINGNVLDKAGMKRLMSKVAYVKQQDIFFQSITVRDQLTYTAQLRIPEKGTTKEERRAKIKSEMERIIDMLRLQKCADSPIMMCSGGEKKRVNIGTELITDPSIIMLDEPTSGLDSASSVSLLNVLKDLARNHGKTIITSIHQPNSATFLNTFDKLLLLSDGNVVYFGKPTESLDYLRTVDLACPEGYNAADHWMDLLVLDPTITSNNTEKSPKYILQKAWDNDALAAKMEVVSELHQSSSIVSDNDNDNKAEGSKYLTSWWTQFTTLLHRAFKKNKSGVFAPVNFLKTLGVGIVVGIVLLDQKYTEQYVHNIFAYFFFTMVFWVMTGMFEALFAFPQERVVIQKERATASYRLSSYFMAMTVADLPVFLVMPLIYMTISYWMVVPTLGFVKYLCILLIALLSVMTGQAFGFLLGAAFDDITIAQAVATIVILFLMLLGGFFVQTIPFWLAWAKYLSPFAYASNAALTVIFNEPVPCDGTGTMSPLCDVGDTSGEIPPQAILDTLNVTLSVGANIGCLLAFCLVPRFFAYTILRRKKPGERE